MLEAASGARAGCRACGRASVSGPIIFVLTPCSSSVFRAPRVNFPHCFVHRLRVPRLVCRVASGYRGFCRFPRKLAPRLRPARWLYRVRSALHAPTAFAPRAPRRAIISDCVRVRALGPRLLQQRLCSDARYDF